MNLKSVKDIQPNQNVILRMDTDVPVDVNQITDNSRILKSLPTLRLLLDRNCHVVILGHRGRPDGNKNAELSLRPVFNEITNLMEDEGEIYESVFIEDICDTERLKKAILSNHIVMIENLRFWSGEEANESEFLKPLSELCQAYVDDAISVAHRAHASIMLYKTMPTYYGLCFIEEIEGLNKAIENPARPVTVILGGAKEDKLKYLSEIAKKVDHVLIGGKMPIYINENKILETLDNETKKIVQIATLNKSSLDINEESIKEFKKIIEKSKTIIWAGAMGMYENEDEKRGTEEIAHAVAKSKAYSILAGGDTSAALRNMGLIHKISFVSSGGGVMLEYLAKGTLPAWSEEEVKVENK